MSNSVSVKKLRDEVYKLAQKNGIINDTLSSELPSSWEKYGDLVLFHANCFSSPFWINLGDDLWKLICSLLKCERIGLKGSIKNDDFRTPKVLLVYGQPGYACFTDNGIKYTWDIERSMFCRGNLSERHRIAKLDCRNEVIVDLFAGIGYFTLPYLVKANADFVHACEWNPYAVKALRANLELNGVNERCKIYEGDNRKFAPKNVGNKINVGLIPDSEGFWSVACEALISSGGIIYIHQNVTSKINKISLSNKCSTCSILFEKWESLNRPFSVGVSGTIPSLIVDNQETLLWKQIEWFYFSLHVSHTLANHLQNIYQGTWKVSIKEHFRIKSYAPHIDHLVYAAHCYPAL